MNSLSSFTLPQWPTHDNLITMQYAEMISICTCIGRNSQTLNRFLHREILADRLQEKDTTTNLIIKDASFFVQFQSEYLYMPL